MACKLQQTLLLIAFMLSIAVMVLGQSSGQCGENMEFNSCGTACPSKCGDNPNEPRPCTANCVVGCFCESGYVLNAAGKCVRPQDC